MQPRLVLPPGQFERLTAKAKAEGYSSLANHPAVPEFIVVGDPMLPSGKFGRDLHKWVYHDQAAD